MNSKRQQTILTLRILFVANTNKQTNKANKYKYDTVSDHLESLSTSVPEILTACRLNGQCSGLYG